MTLEEDSPERQELMRHILFEDELLAYDEERSSREHFLIRLKKPGEDLCDLGRNHVTLWLKTYRSKWYRAIHYQLMTHDETSAELVIFVNGKPISDEELQKMLPWPYVRELCKHRASEAILAVRDNHKRSTKSLQKKRQQRELQKADV